MAEADASPREVGRDEAKKMVEVSHVGWIVAAVRGVQKLPVRMDRDLRPALRPGEIGGQH